LNPKVQTLRGNAFLLHSWTVIGIEPWQSRFFGDGPTDRLHPSQTGGGAVVEYGAFISGVRLAFAEAKALVPGLKGALPSENSYALWGCPDQQFLAHTAP
jgi:hypothetical protein